MMMLAVLLSGDSRDGIKRRNMLPAGRGETKRGLMLYRGRRIVLAKSGVRDR
jgi:hypothetical protein